MLVTFFISLPLLIFLVFTMILGYMLSTKPHQGPKSDNFDGQQFLNPGGAKAKGFPDVLKWVIGRDQGPWTKNYETFVGEKPTPPSPGKIKVTFVNHSTFLIQWKDINILTDPVWSDRCSPFSFAGPQRMRPPGIHFDDLPKIDMVLLSHNHYDHLDITTVRTLGDKFKPKFIVPLGVSAYLKKNGIEHTAEMNWWERLGDQVKITALPTQHFSGRGLFDRDKSLWCGYLIEMGTKKLYFAGDSGYGKHFREIGEKMGPMDISLIPIGAYLPRWFMSPIHVAPEESVKIHEDVKSKQSIAMHFGTFPLADDGMGRAEADLLKVISSSKIETNKFLVPDEGVPMEF